MKKLMHPPKSILIRRQADKLYERAVSHWRKSRPLDIREVPAWEKGAPRYADPNTRWGALYFKYLNLRARGL